MSTPPPPFGQQPGGLPPGLAPGGTATPPPTPGTTPPGWVSVGAGAAPTVPVTAAPGGGRGRNKLLTGLGVLLILGGIVGAVLLALGGSQRYSDGVKDLARGPANCTTRLDVDEDDTYYFYVETKGEVGDVRGDCPATGDSFESDRAGSPSLTLTDQDGDNVRLRRADGTSYDTAGYRGELYRTARLDAGRYQLSVTSDDDVVIAVGSDVADLKPNLLLPIIVGVAGIVVGLLLIVLGRGKRTSTSTPAAAAPGSPPGWSAPA